MNNYYSGKIPYHPRWLAGPLRQAVRESAVTVLTGARQVGKSTLLQQEDPFQHWRYISLDEHDALRQAKTHPEALWAGTDQVILDEVQKAPGLLSAVKRAVDRKRPSIRFLLSGSANLLLMKQVSESLAGRALYFILSPFTRGEIEGSKHGAAPLAFLEAALRGEWPSEGLRTQPTPEITPLLLRGLMPPLLAIREPAAWTRWWDGFVATYLERDLRQISQIDALLDYRRLMELLALRTGQLLNQSSLARDAGLSQPTAHRYLNLLETTHLFRRLPAYTTSHSTRLMKSPKVFWADPALAVFLSGYFSETDLQQARELGCFFKSFLWHHLQVLTQLFTPPGRLFFWRTLGGQEVDFVVEHGRQLLAIEVKQTTQPGYRDANGLRAFLGAHPGATGGLLLHSGREVRRLDEKILAVPWTMITG